MATPSLQSFRPKTLKLPLTPLFHPNPTYFPATKPIYPTFRSIWNLITSYHPQCHYLIPSHISLGLLDSPNQSLCSCLSLDIYSQHSYKIILLKHKYSQVTPLLNTFYWLLISLSIKANVLIMKYQELQAIHYLASH